MIINHNILIAGASGFIGKNLVDFLKSKNFKVGSLSLRDINWKSKINDDYNVIINLVGKAHDHKGIATEEDYFTVNYDYTKQLFYEFLRSNVQLFIHISSIASVEEFHSEIELTETSICNPISFYGKSKFESEKWLLAQDIPEGKKLIILRPPMVHGRGDKGNLGQLFNFLSKGIPYPLNAFDNKRSFISILNFNYFIYQIIIHSTELKDKVYHISDDEPLSTKELIGIINKVLGKRNSNILIPKFLINILANIGEILPIPINKKRLKKLTGSLVVSNQKIKEQLKISKLPQTAAEGIRETIISFSNTFSSE